MLKPLQASTYTFRDLIKSGFVYVDKTRHIYELVRYGKGIYFMSRPRRFGKSLLLSTLEEIFQGNKELFRGLWLYESDYTWPVHPVLRIDFSRHQIRNVADLELRIKRHIQQIANQYQITVEEGPFDIQFEDLILKLAAPKQVVILVDEYDKPILDNIANLEDAKRIRATLRSFYATIKSMDQYIRLVFITGISKFSKVGVFSTMNNLDDLTMDPRFATMLGITEEELQRDFAGHIAAFAQQEGMSPEALLQQIRHWYNGFCFVRGCESVYNPFSCLQLLNKRYFANYWFETGTPTFLIDLIKARNEDIQPLDSLDVPELTFSTYEIESLDLIPLLFQTGYLTIKDFRRDQFGEIYTLSYPNYEVKNAFLSYLLSTYDQIELTLSESHLRRLLYALDKVDLEQFFAVLAVFFANIDYALYIHQERYYQTIFYLIFTLIGLRITAEVHTNQGRIDAVAELTHRIFLFEFKLDGSAEEALQQIKTHDYAQKYRLKGKPLTLIGANFDSTQRKVTDWKSESTAASP
jgi:hypothetical protein